MDSVILVLDLLGTAVFALTGAMKGVRCKLDIFGVVVLACCVGVGGGMVRDCIIGDLPVAALRNQMYLILCFAVGVLTFYTGKYWMHIRNIIQIADAVGLGIFTALGAWKGDVFHLGVIGILLCGTFTAIGGGIIRDIFTGNIPVVLKSDFYATASLAGGLLYCLLRPLDPPVFLSFFPVALFVIVLRLLAMHYHMQLPKSGKKVN